MSKTLSLIDDSSGGVKSPSPLIRKRNLTDVVHGVWHVIRAVVGPENARYRLLDLGFTPGAEVKVAQTAPLGEPLIVVLRGTRLALRKDEAVWIIVE